MKPTSIIDIYEEIMQGKRNGFPKGTWDYKADAVRLLRYVIEDKLQLSETDIKKIDSVFFKKHKLNGMLGKLFDGSPSAALQMVYPGKFKPWELSQVPLNFWNRDTCVDAIKWLIEEKLKWSDDDIRANLCQKVFDEHDLRACTSVLSNTSPYIALNEVYPGRFKPWEIRCAPMSFWTKETAIAATKWLIEDKLKWSEERIKNELQRSTFVHNDLGGMLKCVYNGRAYEAFNDAYPNRFKPWEFHTTPRAFWTEKNCIRAIHWLFEEKLEWTELQIRQNVTVDIFREHGLFGMLRMMYKCSPPRALRAAYPGIYEKFSLKSRMR